MGTRNRYKIPDGKPENKFALDEQCMGRTYAMKVRNAAGHKTVLCSLKEAPPTVASEEDGEDTYTIPPSIFILRWLSEAGAG